MTYLHPDSLSDAQLHIVRDIEKCDSLAQARRWYWWYWETYKFDPRHQYHLLAWLEKVNNKFALQRMRGTQ